MSRVFVESLVTEFRRYKAHGEAVIAQVDDAGLHVQLNPRQASIAVNIQHLHGNMVSRFSDFLTSDGEKPTRDRDGEFVDRNLSRPQLMALWEEGWGRVFAALAALTDADLERSVTIRTERQPAALAIIRQVAHYAWHVGQMALIGKHVVGENWKYLTIPPGGSAEYNRRMGVRER